MDQPGTEQARPAWGGKRSGAGRKPKGYVRPATLAEIDLAHALGEPPPDEIEPVAQQHARLALETFVKQLTHGASEAASVAAANALLDRAYGKPATDVGGTGLLPFMGRIPSRSVAAEIRDQARGYANLAIIRLKYIAEHGRAESARVSAAKSLWDRGLGTAAPAKLDADGPSRPLGKKEEAAIAANAPASEHSGWGDDLQPRVH